MNTKAILASRHIRKVLVAVATAFISATVVTAQTYTGGQHVEPVLRVGVLIRMAVLT